jgi:hypothetical protein
MLLARVVYKGPREASNRKGSGFDFGCSGGLRAFWMFSVMPAAAIEIRRSATRFPHVCFVYLPFTHLIVFYLKGVGDRAMLTQISLNLVLAL